MYQRNYTIYYAIKHINEVTSVEYPQDDIKTINLLFNLTKEGYNLDDFKTVIDKKWAEWKGTQMQQYVRPQTLFGNNFKKYLNEQPRIRKTKLHKLAESVNQAKQHNWKLD